MEGIQKRKKYWQKTEKEILWEGRQGCKPYVHQPVWNRN
jgi:hypothetical protein